MGLFGAVRLDHELPPGAVLQSSREQDMRSEIDVLNAGGPPLLSARRPYSPDLARSDPSSLYPSGAGDDQGLYLYVPLIAHWIGVNDPATVLRWLFIALAIPVIAQAPLLFGLLFDSFAAAVLAPWLIFAQLSSLGVADAYWIVGWCLLFLAPHVWVAACRWKNSGPGLAVLSGALAGLASEFRSQAGAPILVASGITLVVVQTTWRRRVLLGILLVAVYVAAATEMVDAARTYRDQSIGRPFATDYPTSHIFWHGAYLGLGFLPNEYGVAWDDNIAAAAVARLDPGAALWTPRYEAAARALFFEFVREHAGFVVRTYFVKLGLLLRDALKRYAAVLLLLPLAVAFGRRRQIVVRCTILLIPAFVITALPPLVGVPLPAYELGWMAAWALMLMLGVAWLAGECEEFAITIWPEVRRIQAPALRSWSGHPLGRTVRSAVGTISRPAAVYAFGVSILSLATFLALRPSVEDYLDRGFYLTQPAAMLDRVSFPGDEQLATWSWERGLPGDWIALRDVKVSVREPGAVVATNDAPLDYQIMSPGLSLDAGSYRVAVRGRVISGGLYIGVLDARSSTWLATSYYWSGERDFDSQDMVAKFKVSSSTQIRVIVSNWAARPRSSEWLLESAAVIRMQTP